MSYEYHHDAGHGWLKVSHATLASAGLDLTDFTAYSYVDDTHMYLEEDVDAGVFISRVEEITGYPPQWVEVDDGDYSPIRNKRKNVEEG